MKTGFQLTFVLVLFELAPDSRQLQGILAQRENIFEWM